MRQASTLLFLALLAATAGAETIDTTRVPLFSYSLKPCTDEGPVEPFGQPLCHDYDLNTLLMEAARRHDSSAIADLQRRFETTVSHWERHRVARALARYAGNGGRYWKELEEHASVAVRFPRHHPETTPALDELAAQRGVDPDALWAMAFDALITASDDPRSRPLLLAALATDDQLLAGAAIEGLARLGDASSLPAIEAALERFPDAAGRMAIGLAWLRSDEAHRIALRFLSETARYEYDDSRGRDPAVAQTP